MGSMLLNLWKMFKYSFVKFSVIEKAQELEGLTPLKVLNMQRHDGFHMALQHKELSRGLVH